ncbi:Flp pilus assembly pilin Flp [Roseomonas alkaliterrae]|uniref:Flp pilus assembly pilin Flp n=1 Tax=Neoroseomonas alkaliterrae TaxID=1452450 RepID=A0A840XQW4_9PROT|nr:Flp family type IVb pilin [Neoroseomonas alkaliterrae]MBB5690296.1 Flp pilus assembly pilin Flp [Neoroseomonas alkaliterrae]
MRAVQKIWHVLRRGWDDRKGVTSAEYAILAVGVVIVVGGAILAFDINNPMNYAGQQIVAGQSSLAATAR